MSLTKKERAVLERVVNTPGGLLLKATLPEVVSLTQKDLIRGYLRNTGPKAKRGIYYFETSAGRASL